jgi:amino-acid N-acetyltransferase
MARDGRLRQRPKAVTATIRAAAPGDFPGVIRLLESAGLPTAGLEPSLPNFLVAEKDGSVVGAIGLEIYGESGLLRSAAVEAGWRGSGLGRALVASLLDLAEARGVRDVYLLTTTAEGFFPRFGFARVARSTVAPAVRASEEFRGACPDSAIAMRRVTRIG